MAPNEVGLKVPIVLEKDDSVYPLRKEMYEGFYYDLTDFIQRNPGGYEINSFTEPGEDGTLVIQRFHQSIKQVLAMMNALPKRPAKDKADQGKGRKMHSYLRILPYAIKSI
jgi:hypothetical protein